MQLASTCGIAALTSYVKMREDDVDAFIGAARSAVSTPLAELGAIHHLPQVHSFCFEPSDNRAMLRLPAPLVSI